MKLDVILKIPTLLKDKPSQISHYSLIEDEPFYYVGLDGLIFNHNDLEIFCTNKEIIDKFYRKKIVYSNISIEYILRLIKCAKNYSEASIYNLYSEKKVIDDEIPF